MTRFINIRVLAIFSTLYWFFCPVASGQVAIELRKIKGTIDFDGRPVEKVWGELDSFNLTMWRPNFGKEPSEKSDIRIGYDDEYLWVGASLYMKDASKIFVATKKRDEILWDYDAFGIVLDTYNDNETGLAFFTNPAGLRTDFAISNDGTFSAFADPTNRSWDTFWDVKTSRDDKGWYLEMRIPFSGLKFKAENGVTIMGLIIERNISSNTETDLYPAIDAKYGFSAFIKPSQAVKIKLEGIKPTNPVYIAPYLLAGISRDQILDEGNTRYITKDHPKFTGGLDIKYNINSNLTLDLTANTDFAQVEADDQQVNLTQYSLFFPEKRKFFQERSSLFDFKLGGLYDNLFYSRNIGLINGKQVQLLGGARMTGRIGKWDVGVLDMQTAEFDTIPGENFGVFRMRRQIINQNSYVGGIVTSRIGLDGSCNLSYGMDGIIRLFGDDYLNLKWARNYDSKTDTRLNSLNPAFYMINWERRSREGLGYNIDYIYSGKDFNPGTGFLMRHGVQGADVNVLYGWMPGEKSKILRYGINFNSTLFKRLSDGSIETLILNPFVDIGTKTGIYLNLGEQYQKISVLYDFNLSDRVIVFAGNYSFAQTILRIFTTRNRTLSFMSEATFGQFYDGKITGVNFGPVINFSSIFNVNLNYSLNAIRFPERISDNALNIHSIKAKVLP